MDKYDVFISCKSEDYRYAEEVYDFLNENHIHTFLASKELRKLGDSEYREAIEEALDVAEHLIVLSSKPEYVKSKWVKYEWGLFLNDKIDGHKTGNILTILLGFEPHSLVIALRKYESFRFESYKETLLNYVETNESKARLKEIKIQRELEEKQRKEKEDERNRKEQLKKELILLAEEYKKKETNLSIDIAKIRSILKSLDITPKKCPVCSNEVHLDNDYCENCGWEFHPLDGLPDIEYLLHRNENSLSKYETIYYEYTYSLDKLSKLNYNIADLTNALKSRDERISWLSEELSKTEDEILKKIDTIASLQKHIKDLKHSLNNYESSNSKKEHQILELANEIETLKGKIEEKDKSLEQLRLELKNNKPTKSALSFSTKTAITAATTGLAMATFATLKMKGSSKSTSKRYYSVWMSHCPASAMDIVRQWIPSISKNELSNIKTRPIKVATFGTESYAVDLKNKLESKGATVIINNEDNITPSLTNNASTNKTSTGYGVWIKNCTKAALPIIQEWIPSFTINDIPKVKSEPLLVASFSTKSYASDLKNLLECKGAKAEIIQA